MPSLCPASQTALSAIVLGLVLFGQAIQALHYIPWFGVVLRCLLEMPQEQFVVSNSDTTENRMLNYPTESAVRVLAAAVCGSSCGC